MELGWVKKTEEMTLETVINFEYIDFSIEHFYQDQQVMIILLSSV